MRQKLSGDTSCTTPNRGNPRVPLGAFVTEKGNKRGTPGEVPSSFRQVQACQECEGWGQFWTANRDGRFGPLYPFTLPCPDSGGEGLVILSDGRC